MRPPVHATFASCCVAPGIDIRPVDAGRSPTVPAMSTRLSLVRTRWAAIGAAIAVTLGGGGLMIADAAADSDPSLFRSIEPCRLADFRPETNVGDKVSPIGPGEVHTITATGPSGDCDLPTSATAIVANVTAVGATAPTNVRLYPAGAEVPTTSNLNPVPGQPPTPNAVTVGLNSSGQFSIRNAFGSVDLIVDLVGYYELPSFDDRYADRDVTVRLAISGAVGIGQNPPLTAQGCVLDGTGIVLPVDIPAGATITGATVDIRSLDGSGLEYLFFLHKQTVTATGSAQATIAGLVGANAINLPTVQRNRIELVITDPSPLEEGEHLRFSFTGGGADHALCSASISYRLPPTSD